MAHRTSGFLWIFAALMALWLFACTSVRQTKPLAYPGDGRSTVDSIAAVVRKKGFEPVVRDREFCKFKYNDRIWIHFKARPRDVVLAVDVADGKKLAPAELDALTKEAMLVGEDIWKEASADATAKEARLAKEKQDAEARKGEEERRKDEEERKASAEGKSGTSAIDVLNTIGKVAGSINVTAGGQAGGAPASGSSPSYCCINHQYFDCPTPNAVRKACGELSACLLDCMSKTEMGCGDRCIKNHPPDVSECRRDTGRDQQCTN